MIASSLKYGYPAWYLAAISIAIGIGVLIWDKPWKGVVLIAVGAVIALWAAIRTAH